MHFVQLPQASLRQQISEGLLHPWLAVAQQAPLTQSCVAVAQQTEGLLPQQN